MSPYHLSGPPSLESQVALVTGAGGGFGQAICKTLLDAGATVVATDLAESSPFPGWDRLYYSRYDVSSKADTDKVIDAAIDTHGGIDILVLCAGTIARTHLSESTDEEWDSIFAVNVRGVVNPMRKLFPHMEKRGYGKIVACGSVAAKNGGFASGPAYVAAKSAVHGLIRWVAKAGAPHGIYANTIAPGPVETKMFASIKSDTTPTANTSVPLGRFGQPEDVAQTVLFLSSQASNWITGTSIDISGGMWMD